jgi:hypothetical protein
VGHPKPFLVLSLPARKTCVAHSSRFSAPSLLIPYLSLTPPLVERRSTKKTMEHAMQDLLMVVLAAVFFGVALLYIRGCDKLR